MRAAAHVLQTSLFSEASKALVYQSSAGKHVCETVGSTAVKVGGLQSFSSFDTLQSKVCSQL